VVLLFPPHLFNTTILPRETVDFCVEPKNQELADFFSATRLGC